MVDCRVAGSSNSITVGLYFFSAKTRTIVMDEARSLGSGTEEDTDEGFLWAFIFLFDWLAGCGIKIGIGRKSRGVGKNEGGRGGWVWKDVNLIV